MIIDDLHFLGERLRGWLCGAEDWADLDAAVDKSFQDNVFFSVYMQKSAMGIIADDFLDRDKLSTWISEYLEKSGKIEDLLEFNKGKRVGIVMAGNIPLVGFSDVLAVLITGAEPIIKLSSKDTRLLPILFPNLIYLETNEFESQSVDAIITMGGSDSAAHFEKKFSGTKALIRGSRFSVGLILGQESDEDLRALAQDILLYYGMGCRSITRLFVPRGYDFTRLAGFINTFLKDHSLTFLENQYLRNKALLLIDKMPFFDTGSFLLVESDSNRVPVSTLAYTFYTDRNEVENYVQLNKNYIQKFFCTFGNAQRPSLLDYPDGVDSLKFLFKL